jgi:hypothetical protein
MRNYLVWEDSWIVLPQPFKGKNPLNVAKQFASQKIGDDFLSVVVVNSKGQRKVIYLERTDKGGFKRIKFY